MTKRYIRRSARLSTVTLALAGMLTLAACGAGAPSAPTASSAGGTTLLGRYGLEGLSTQQIIEKLDVSEADRTHGPVGSVRPDQLLLTDPATGEKQSLAVPQNQFYLAMAPYENVTHECFNHNLATCRGELVGEQIHVTLVTEDGRTVVDKDVTTMANGFAGVWVPRDLKGQLTVSAKGKKVTVPVSTTEKDPTCLTTPLKLG